MVNSDVDDFILKS